MNVERFQNIAKSAIKQVVQDDKIELTTVWFAKALQNYKGLFADVRKNVYHGLEYYEVTYNGDKKELYVDRYQKISNQKFDIND